uniref:Uncharacterized protein n=1 Tax=Catagonus wagneri TaxID=51154 RepID=A0A8C3WDJ5_9CETA
VLTLRKRSFISPGAKKVRSSTQRKRNRKLQSSIRLIRKLWTHKFCEESRLFLSSRACPHKWDLLSQLVL